MDDTPTFHIESYSTITDGLSVPNELAYKEKVRNMKEGSYPLTSRVHREKNNNVHEMDKTPLSNKKKSKDRINDAITEKLKIITDQNMMNMKNLQKHREKALIMLSRQSLTLKETQESINKYQQ